MIEKFEMKIAVYYFLRDNLFGDSMKTLHKKIEIIDMLNRGYTINELHLEFNIPISTLYSWKSKYYKENKTKNSDLSYEVYHQRRRLEKLESELEILQKCSFVKNASLQSKLISIHELKDEYSIHSLCDAVGVHRSTYIHYRNNINKERLLQQEDTKFKQEIERLFYDSKERYGSKKIRAIMVQNGIIISVKRVSRLMKELNLVCKSNRKRIDTKSFSRYRSNKLKRKFTQTEPNLVWVSDITSFYVGEDLYSLVVIIDLFSRKVINYDIDKTFSSTKIMKLFTNAYSLRNKPNCLMFHSDQGTQYTSYDFRKLLRDLSVNQSFSEAGNPIDNSVAEAFFSCLKREELHQHRFDIIEEANIVINEYIHFYNETRPHARLDNLTPAKTEENYYINKK